MSNTKFFICVMVFIVISTTLFAEKRSQRDPAQISSLSNPDSQNYVPFPFPKKRKEIIADLVHFMQKRKHRLKRKSEITYGKRIECSLIEKDGCFHINRILKVPNRIATLNAPYVFVIQINHEDGRTVAFYALEDTGLFAGANVEGSESSSFKPMRNAVEISHELLKNHPLELGGKEEILTISPIHLQNSLRVCYLHHPPTWEIKLRDGRKLLYFDTIDKQRLSRLFRIHSSIQCSHGKGKIWTNTIIKIRKKGLHTALDSLNNRIYVLEEVE